MSKTRNSELNNNSINDLVLKMYEYFLYIGYDTHCDVALYIEDFYISFQSLYNSPAQLVKKIINDNKIEMVFMKDLERGYEASIYLSHFIEGDVQIGDNGNAKITYNDGYKTSKFYICKSTF